MTSKEAMKIIEQRHLTTPEAYEVVHALFEAERREAALEKLCDDATQLDGERECWLSERSVRDVLSPPSSWPTNEAESEALRQERGMAQVRESASPPPTEPGLREALIKELSLNRIDSYLDNIEWRKDAPPILREGIRGHIYHFARTILEDLLACDFKGNPMQSARTPPQKPAETPERWVCSECGKEFDHRPGPHRIKYGGPLCDGTAVEKGSDRWACDDCMMRDMTEAEGNAHHASTGHSVSSKWAYLFGG